jgi:hypothetical protein
VGGLLGVVVEVVAGLLATAELLAAREVNQEGVTFFFLLPALSTGAFGGLLEGARLID